jgi:hypothetical protein
MSADSENVAAVLALVRQEPATVEVDVPVPPNGSSDGAQALWYALLNEYEFNLVEMVILEQLVTVQSHLDEIEADWRRDGSPTTALGSTGQSVTDPRIQEMRMLRQQVAALVKQLALPAGGDQQKKRPGRPTRSAGGGAWGITR